MIVIDLFTNSRIYHDCDRLVHKLQKSIMILTDLFTNSKSRSLFTNVCDRDQIRSESDHELKCPVFATFAVCFYVCKLIYSINVIFKHLFRSFRAFLERLNRKTAVLK